MTISRTDAVECENFAAASSRLWLGTEIEFDGFPSVAAVGLQAQGRRWLIAAMNHAIFASAVARNPLDNSVAIPLGLLEQFGVSAIMPVGHQITGAFPTTYVSGWNRPSGTSQVAFACEKFKINRRAEKGVTIHPLLDFVELFNGHFARKEEIFRSQVEPFDHVLFSRVIFVTGRDSVTVHAEIGEIIEHPFDLLHVSLFLYGRIRRDLVAEDLRHLDGQNAFFENAFALHNEVVCSLQTIEVHVPIHPFAWA